MKNLTLKNLQAVTGGKLVNARDVSTTEITAIVSDSRKIREDCLFLCIKGEKVDGHDFAAKAVEDGALAVVCDHKIEHYKGPYLLVNSVLDATQAIAEFYRLGLGVKVVGITGSVGKTSTKEFISAVLSQKYKVRKTKGNLNNQWGVPFTIFDLKETDEVAVIEMGIGDIGEMDPLARMVRPDIAFSLDIGTADDVCGGKKEEAALGKGPELTFMDNMTLSNRKLIRFAVEVAEECGIPYQTSIMKQGGTDAGKFQFANTGIPVLLVNVPCRYAHTPTSMIHYDDYKNTIRLMTEIVRRLDENKVREICRF